MRYSERVEGLFSACVNLNEKRSWDKQYCERIEFQCKLNRWSVQGDLVDYAKVKHEAIELWRAHYERGYYNELLKGEGEWKRKFTSTTSKLAMN